MFTIIILSSSSVISEYAMM